MQQHISEKVSVFPQQAAIIAENWYFWMDVCSEFVGIGARGVNMYYSVHPVVSL